MARNSGQQTLSLQIVMPRGLAQSRLRRAQVWLGRASEWCSGGTGRSLQELASQTDRHWPWSQTQSGTFSHGALVSPTLASPREDRVSHWGIGSVIPGSPQQSRLRLVPPRAGESVLLSPRVSPRQGNHTASGPTWLTVSSRSNSTSSNIYSSIY